MGTGWGRGTLQRCPVHTPPLQTEGSSAALSFVLDCFLFQYLSIWLCWVLVATCRIFDFCGVMQPTPVCLPGKSCGQRRSQKSWTRLSATEHTHRHVGSSVVACGIWFPDQGSNLGPPCIGRMESQPLDHQGSPWAVSTRGLCAVDKFSSCLLVIPHLFIDSRNIYSPIVCQDLVWSFEDTQV